MRFLRRTAGYTRWDHKRNEDILAELRMSQITEFIYKYMKNWKDHVDRMSSERIQKMIIKYQTKREKKFKRTFEKMEGFSFVTPVIGLNRRNAGKEDDDDDGPGVCLG
jgi:tRNA G10  N-methylase Trm11